MQRRTFLGAIGCIPALALASPSAPASLLAQAGVTKKKSASRRVGIAFGGGSIHGMAHVGVLKALHEKGLELQLITGTSAGAIIGVLAAAKLPISKIDQIAREIEWPGVMDLAWSGKGFMRHTKLQTQIDRELGNRLLEELPVPFGAIATDVATGERVVIRKGPAGAAISASCSVPVMFAPVKIDGRDLVDGGLTEPVPVIALREMGADMVIGVDVAFRPAEDQFTGLSGVAFQTMHIMANALIKEQIRHADVAIRMDLHRLVGMANAHEELLAAGYSAALRAWPKIALMVSS